MSVYRRASGRYAVLIDVDRGPPASGYRHVRHAQGRGSGEALSARDRGTNLSPQSVTVAELMRRYLQDRIEHCSGKTLQEYNGKSALYIVPRLGSMLLAKLRPAHIAEWQGELVATGGAGGKPLSGKTVNHARSLLFGALDWAVKMQIVSQNVCVSVDAPKVSRSHAKALGTDETARLLETVAPTRWGPFVNLALSTGSRRGELLALRWADVDLERRTMTVRASLSQTRVGGVMIKCTKTDAVHTALLSPFAFEALRKQRSAQAADKLRAGESYSDSGFVFANEFGRCISPMAATNAYARLARKAGISSSRLHDTRHSAATLLLTSGVDARTVAGILGHSSPVTTMTTYAHLLSEAQRDAVDRLGAALETLSKRSARY